MRKPAYPRKPQSRSVKRWELLEKILAFLIVASIILLTVAVEIDALIW